MKSNKEQYISNNKGVFPDNSVLIILLLSLLYMLLCLAWVNGRPEGIFWTVDEGGKLVFIQNVIRTNSILKPIEYPSQDLDPSLRFVPFTYTNVNQGKLLSWWLPFFPLVTIPFYKMMGWLGLYILPAFGGGLTLTATGLLIREIVPEKRWLAYIGVGITGFATPILFYSTMFWEHSLAVGAALFTVYLCLRGQSNHNYFLFILAGISGALAFTFRTEIIFVLLGIGLVLLFVNWRQAFTFGISFLIICLPVFYFNWRSIGHPFNIQLNHIVSSTDFKLLNIGIKSIPYFIFHVSKPWTYPMNKELMVVGSIGFLLGMLIPFFNKKRLLFVLGYCLFLFICGIILISSFGYKAIHGFAEVTPHVALFTWFFLNWQNHRKKVFTWYVLIGSLIFGIFYLYKAWIGAGGMQWGTRYILLYYPVFTVLFVIGISEHFLKFQVWMKYIFGGVVFCSIMIGVGFQVRGLLTVEKVMKYYQASEEGLDYLKDRPVVTRFCDPALIYDGRYWDQTIFSATWTGIDEWIQYAKQTGIKSFYSIRLDICSSDPLHIVEQNRKTNVYGLDVLLYEAPDYVPVPFRLP